jgi:hypothetical protein
MAKFSYRVAGHRPEEMLLLDGSWTNRITVVERSVLLVQKPSLFRYWVRTTPHGSGLSMGAAGFEPATSRV